MAKGKVCIYIEKEYYEKIKKLAKKADRKISYYINNIFKNFLKNKRG